ncbi:RING-type E3 ubiquitin transferase [Heracleum sosnowskyi]|uniref:U-box domain-containing protein n=1 Tax=Heracleum sosnowskyi TaxID=360622 RepID=A0AAD8HRS8_9APIA|nr:RING-type E3 ubiquitin transferase [Heracleum sosnowskyi]
MAIPCFFMCPISLELFRDPVTLCTGQTYERSSIEKWLATGNLICPVTMQKLHDPSLVPNHTLRHLIDQWLQKGHYLCRNELSTMPPGFSIVSIRQKLESREASLGNKLDLLSDIEKLSEEQPDNIYRLIQLGLFSLLLQLVFGIGEEHLKFVEKTLVCAIKLLPFSDARSLNILQEDSKFARLVLLFDQGNLVIKKSLCQLLVEALSSYLYTEDFCIALGKEQPLLQEMVNLVFDDNNDASEAGIKSISAFCSYESNKENAVRVGIIQGLVKYISRPKRREISMVSKAMATIEDLLGQESAKAELMNDPNGVKALVKMVFCISDNENSESALNSLMMLCYDSFRAREEAICAGVLTQLLRLLQSQCNDRTKTKATMLLKLLTSYM